MARDDIEKSFPGLRVRVSPRAAAYILAAIMGGGGASLLTDMVHPPRPDPYTGEDGIRDRAEWRRLHERQRIEISEIQKRLRDIELLDKALTSELAHVHERLDEHLNKKRPH